MSRPLKKQKRLLDKQVEEIEFEKEKAQAPPIFTNSLDPLDEGFHEGSEVYFEKLVDIKLISYFQLDLDYLKQ